MGQPSHYLAKLFRVSNVGSVHKVRARVRESANVQI